MSVGGARTLKRTEFSSSGDYLGQIRGSRGETRLYGSHHTRKAHGTRAFAALSRLEVNSTDCVADHPVCCEPLSELVPLMIFTPHWLTLWGG